MRNEHHRAARFAARILQQFQNSLARFVIERARGLVAQQKLRVFGDGARDSHTLLLAARELRGEVVHAMREPHLGQHVGRLKRIAANLARELHVFERGKVLNQVIELENEADVVTAVIGELLFVELVDARAVEHNGTRCA